MPPIASARRDGTGPVWTHTLPLVVRRSPILVPIALCLTLTLAGVGAPVAGTAAAGAEDDQTAADAAIAVFAERMTAAGGVADDFGATDTDVSPATMPGDTDIADANSAEPTSTEPTTGTIAEPADDDPFAACLEDLDALERDGRFEGETARAFSAPFVFEPADQPDDSNDLLGFLDDDVAEAGVVYVEEDEQQALADFVDTLVAKETVACLEDLMEALAGEGQPGDSGEVGTASYESSVQAQSGVGIGDASARLQFDVSSNIDGSEFALSAMVHVAQTGRSLAFVTVSVNGDLDADVDAAEELRVIVDSL